MPQTKPDFSGLTLDMLESVEPRKNNFDGLTLDMLETPGEEKPDFSNLPKIYDEFETSSPEELYQVMKQNPGRAYSRDQWNTYLEYMAEKDFSPTEVIKNFTSGIGPVVMEAAGGGLELLKMGASAAGVLNPENTDPDKFKKVGDLAATGVEGALRAGYDLGIIGQMVQLNNALQDSVATPSGSYQGYGSGYTFPTYKKRTYKDFPEEKKNQVIDLAMKLSKTVADRNSYAEGKGTILGDTVGSFLTSDEDSVATADSVKDYLLAAVNPKAAEMLSIVNPLAPETIATRLGTKYGKPIQMGATKAVLDAAATGVEKSAEAVTAVGGKLKELTAGFGDDTADIGKVRGVSPGVAAKSLQTIADTLKAASRQVDESGSDNFLLRMSRDGEFARNNPRMHRYARFWGHGIYNDVPFLSPLLRMAAPVGNIVIDAAAMGARGAIAGGIMALPTGDEEMTGVSMAGGFGIGGIAGAGRRAFWNNKIQIESEAKRFMSQMAPELQEIIQRRIDAGELGMGDIARMSAFESWAKRFTSGVTGDTDVDFVYWDGKDIERVEAMLINNGVDQSLPLDHVQAKYENQFENKDADRIISPTRGVQMLNTRQAGSKPIVLVNLERMTKSTLIHESIHALKRLDLYQGAFDDIEGILFDRPGRGDDEATNGMISDADLERFYREYLDRFIKSANTPEQLESGKRMVRDIIKMDQRRADNATPGTPQSDVAYWQRVRMKEEVVADVFESFLTNKNPLYITQAGLETNAQKLGRPFSRVAKTMATWIGATTPSGALSVQNYSRDGKRIAYDSPALEASINNLINFQNRVTEKNGKLTRAEVSEGESGESFRANQIRKGSALARSLEASILVKHDENGNAVYDSDGNIVFEGSQKAVRDKETARANFFRDTISNQVINDDEKLPGKQPVRLDVDTGEITGDYLHQDTLKALRNAPRYLMPKRLLDHLETINEAAKTGNVIEIDYNPRLYTQNGRTVQKAQYSSALGSTIRHVVPFSMRITKAGNFTFNALDITHLIDKYNRVMRDSRRSKNITDNWGGDRAAFQKDLLQYLENATNPPEQYEGGLARGLDDNPAAARKKANVLSAFMGFKKKDIDWRNNTSRQDALLRDMNPERQDNVIRTRRLDAVNAVRSTDMPRMPLSQSAYRDIQRNLEPGGNEVRKRPFRGSRVLSEQPFVRGQNASFTTRPGLIFFEPAFHGSGADFDRFDIEMVGTGEGNAAYGYGLYAAQDRNIGEGYRKQLADGSSYTVEELRSFFEVGSIIPAGFGGYDKVIDFNATEDGKWTATVVRVEPPTWNPPGNEKPRTHSTAPSDRVYEHVTGNERGFLYKVDLNIDDSNALQWDKRLSQQSESVRQAVEKISKSLQSGGSNYANIQNWENFQKLDPSGASIYKSIEEYYRIDEEQNGTYEAANKMASEALLANGVRGIKYLDGPSRKKKDRESFNYVMFDDADIKILEKNDQPIRPSDVVKMFDPGDAKAQEDKIRRMDVGDKSRKQVGLSIADYPDNPDPNSVALPARMGVVNRNIAGVPNSYAEVLNIVEEQVARIRNVIRANPDFALAAANFYRDMAEVGHRIARPLAVNGPDGKPQVYSAAELMLRMLALGSPRTGVAANATKSVRSTMAIRDQPAGHKIGMGTGQLGAKKAAKDWSDGKHFDVLSDDAIGADDKVRNFYLNSLADLIEMAAADQDLTPSERRREVLKLRHLAAKTLGLTTGKMTPELETKVAKFLDGLATVDMWDMAAKGYATGGYIPVKNRKKKGAYQWSVPKHRVKSTIDSKMFAEVLRESEIRRANAKGELKKRAPKSISELDYQHARSLLIDGRRDWNAESWADRVAEGFEPNTEFSYYKKNDEAGLSPGGGGPVYDAQQMIDGLIADRVNELGLASQLGKEKFKARNAQEVIWALEKSDNPLLGNRELVRFGDRLKEVADAFDKLAAGEDLGENINEKAATAFRVIQETYNATSEQSIPIEVTSEGTTPTARKIQNIQDIAGVEAMTQAVADGLADGLQSIVDGMGVDVSISGVVTGFGAFRLDTGDVQRSPNMSILLRGEPALSRTIMQSLTKAWDQEGGNLIRRPTLQETMSGQEFNTAIQFDTRHMSSDQVKEFYGELASLMDETGNPFLTGYTETPDGIFIGDHFYNGDMQAEIVRNTEAIDEISGRYKVPKFQFEEVVVETYTRPEDVKDSPATDSSEGSNPELARLVMSYAKRKLNEARSRVKAGEAGPVNQAVDRVEYAKRLPGRVESFRVKEDQKDFETDLGSRVDLAVMDGALPIEKADDIKKELKKMVAEIPVSKELTKKETLNKYRTILDREIKNKSPWLNKGQVKKRKSEIAADKAKKDKAAAKKKAKQ